MACRGHGDFEQPPGKDLFGNGSTDERSTDGCSRCMTGADLGINGVELDSSRRGVSVASDETAPDESGANAGVAGLRCDFVVPPLPVTAWIGVGANLGDAAANVLTACQAFDRQYGVSIVGHSRRFRNPPLGPAQPDYVNAVVRVETRLSARELLETLWALEIAAGRDYSAPRWGARVLDLDLLLFGDSAFEVPDLCVPHAGLSERPFVLLPMRDVLLAGECDWPIPVAGQAPMRLSQLIAALPAGAVDAMQPIDECPTFSPAFGRSTPEPQGVESDGRVARIVAIDDTDNGFSAKGLRNELMPRADATAPPLDRRGAMPRSSVQPWMSPAA